MPCHVPPHTPVVGTWQGIALSGGGAGLGRWSVAVFSVMGCLLWVLGVVWGFVLAGCPGTGTVLRVPYRRFGSQARNNANERI